jgi:hypothetical protein
MKHIITFFLFLSFYLIGAAQPYPEFSPLSRSPKYNFSATETNGNLFYCIRSTVGDTMAIYTTYKLNTDGQIIDSVSHSPDGIDRWGWIAAQEGRIFFHGIRWIGSAFTNIRHTVIEYNQQLEQVGETIGASLTPSTGFIISQSTGFITMTQMADFHLYNDTLLAAYQFLMVDSPFVSQGRRNFFLKTGLDGTVYVKKELPVNEMYNVFFGNGKMYVQGSTYVSPFDPRALSEFDSNGDLLRGIDYDTWGSGEFLEGSLGGWHKGRFYITYVGKDDSLPGCAVDNAAIDVRDSSWTILHRFKLPDCGYGHVSGKTPFTFDTQDNIYYTASDAQTLKKIIIYKFTPDFQVIWNKVLDFSDENGQTIPASLLTTSDGGVVINCMGLDELKIFKISADGDLVSSTHLPLSNEITGPMVYPNPTAGSLDVLPDYSVATVAQVTSMDGRVMGVFDLRSQQIDLSAYPTGVYAISLWDEGLRKLLGTEMVVKQ